MENREKICNYDQLIKALGVCAEIQNSGIGTVFCEFYGHVNRTAIRIHLPLWINGDDPDYRFELNHDKDEEGDDFNHKSNIQTISWLEEILQRGKLPEESEQEKIRDKEKQLRKQQYEELKREFEPA